MSPTSILRRHRLAALLGAAIILSPFALSPVLQGPRAHAAEQQPTAPLTGSLAANGSFAAVVAADKPAVVTITTKMKADPSDASNLESNSPFDEYFRQFFGEQGMPQAAPRRPAQQTEALGSGFIIASDGTIVTNNHVIDGATEITVTLDDGTQMAATLVGRDAKTDLAVLKVTPTKSLPTVSWGDSDKLRLGDPILAIGNPFGIGTTVTAGIVSARGRDLHSGPYDDFIQVDAPINHGNSGGPLVAGDGTVVGITSAIYSPNGGSVGVGFAIPSDQARAVVAKLMKDGSIEHGYIGVQIQPVTPDVADAIGLDHASGALVAHVVEDSPAAQAGIETGDVITSVAGREIKGPKDLSRTIADVAPGARETVDLWRKGQSVQATVVVGQNGDEQKMAAAENEGRQAPNAGLRVPALGLGLTDITPRVRKAMNLPDAERGALVESVSPEKAAAAAGIQAGDVIISVNNAPVKSANEASRAVSQANKSGRKTVLLLIQRGEDQTFIAVPLAHA